MRSGASGQKRHIKANDAQGMLQEKNCELIGVIDPWYTSNLD
jgi:hypothetical protein